MTLPRLRTVFYSAWAVLAIIGAYNASQTVSTPETVAAEIELFKPVPQIAESGI